MRSPKGPSRLFLCLATMLIVPLLLGFTAGEAHADAAQVTVVSPGGAQQTLALEALAGSEDVHERAYVLRSAAGDSSQTVTGFSLAAVVEAAGADPFGFSYLEVQRPAGGSVQLSRHQALDPGAFPEGPPAIYATGGGTGFLRPSSGAGDFNAEDSFTAPQGLTIVLRKGSGLVVRAEASPLRTRPGKPVRFSAVVDRAGSGEQLTYSWYFGDGNSATSPSPVHRFAEPGSYKVLVGVTTPGDDVGASDVVRIQVGPAVEGGPDRQGGGNNKDKDAPDQGAATGPSGSGAESESAATLPAPAASVPPPAAPAPTPVPQPQPDQQTPAPAPSGEVVSGLLVSDTSAVQPSLAPEQQQAAARTGSPTDGSGGGGGLPGAALGLLITAGLLGAGGLIEARGLIR